MKSGYPRQANCKICGGEYERRNLGHVVCCPSPCGFEYKRQKDLAKARKAERADTKRRKEKLKTRGDYLREAQAVFNRFIRLRDAGKPCISCGWPDNGAKRDAGHYRTVKAAPELRFHPWNCAGQCVQCNSHKSGNVVEYRIELVKRIGSEAVEWLEGPHQAQHWTIEDIQEIKAHYMGLCKEIEKRR